MDVAAARPARNICCSTSQKETRLTLPCSRSRRRKPNHSGSPCDKLCSPILSTGALTSRGSCDAAKATIRSSDGLATGSTGPPGSATDLTPGCLAQSQRGERCEATLPRQTLLRHLPCSLQPSSRRSCDARVNFKLIWLEPRTRSTCSSKAGMLSFLILAVRQHLGMSQSPQRRRQAVPPPSQIARV